MAYVVDYRQYFPWMAEGGSVSRPLPDRLTDLINIKDHSKGDGVSDPTGIGKFLTKLASGYTHGNYPNVAATAREGRVPGGLFNVDPITAGNFVIGQSYVIVALGNTNFTLIGANTNNIGTSFTALGPGSGTGTANLIIRTLFLAYGKGADGLPADIVTAGSFVVGDRYQIVTVGTTNYTLIGSPNNTVGTLFRATDVGTGSGTALPVALLGMYSYTIRGGGPTSQLRDVSMEIDVNRVNVQDIRLTGSYIPGVAGLDIRAANGYYRNVDINNYDVGIANTTSHNPGSFGSSNQINGGWLRGNRIGVSAAQADLRLNFLRIADCLECGIDYYDGGGLHFVGNHSVTDWGPAIRLRGKNINFQGDIVAGSSTISNITDFSGIVLNDVITASGIGNFSLKANTRVTAINEGAGTITISPAALLDSPDETIVIRYSPFESYHINNTYNTGGFGLTDPVSKRLEFNIVSIATANAGASILITLDAPHWGIMVTDVSVSIDDTSNAAYNDQVANAVWIEALPTETTIQINLPYSGPSTGGKFLARGFDLQVTSEGNNNWVLDQFFIGGNHNRNIFQGGVNLNFIGTRMNSKMYFDGCRPFFGDRTLGSPIITNVGIPTSEIRIGLPITGGGIPPGSKVIAKTATTVTIDKNATATASTKIYSPYQTNNWFHVPVITAGLNEGAADVPYPRGPGSLVGWGQVGMFPIGTMSYAAEVGNYYVGMRAPYTEGGLVGGSPRYLNMMGVLNSTVRWRSQNVQYDVVGQDFRVNFGRLTFEENSFGQNNQGVLYLPAGASMITGTRAYRSSTGANWGNAVHQWSAPRYGALESTSTVGGAIVLPANQADLQSNIFLVACNTLDPDFTGDRTAIRALQSVMELNTLGQMDLWAGGINYARLSDAASDSFLRVDQDSPTRFAISNTDPGPNATAVLTVRNQAAVEGGFRLVVAGTGFTNGGAPLPYMPADGAVLISGSLLSGGMSLVALAGTMRVFTGATPTLAMTINGTDQFIGIAGATTPLAPLDIGNSGGITPADPSILLRRTVSGGTDSAHGVMDNTLFTRVGSAYAAYDDLSRMTGTGGFGHHRSFQARPIIDIAGTMTFAEAFYSELDNTNASTVITAFRHFNVGTDSGFAGSLGTQWGLYVSGLSKGTVDNWGIWVQNNKCHFGAPIDIGTKTLSQANAFAPLVGSIANISDSTVNTLGTVVAGGGANRVLAWYNGTNWTVIGV